jgi:S-DNA-T family DNA segregation ATPase FtsK/SpoIIIE
MTPTAPFSIDLRRDGPHTLIAGPRDRAKSELLQTLVASLALVNRPDELVFVLVDYKGGAAFDRCGQLPHTVGLVTDLDAHLTRARWRRCQRSCGVGSGCSVRRASPTSTAMSLPARSCRSYPRVPRLVIVGGRVRGAGRGAPRLRARAGSHRTAGRSLGVHLVLATQRPGGAVSADIRANTALRIALRVSDPGESTDIVGVRDAAFLPKEAAGRAVARSGSEPTTLFQCARVTAPRRREPQPGVTVLPWSATRCRATR